MWVRINDALVCTELPIMSQLAAIGAKLKLTANNPYPTFSMVYNDRLWLFNEKGGKVDTMAGTLSAISFDYVSDIRNFIPELDWEEIKGNDENISSIPSWSEHDDALNNIIHTIESARDSFTTEEIKESYAEDLAWLNSLKERLQKS